MMLTSTKTSAGLEALWDAGRRAGCLKVDGPRMDIWIYQQNFVESVLPGGKKYTVLDCVHNLHGMAIDIAHTMMPCGGHHGVLGSVVV